MSASRSRRAARRSRFVPGAATVTPALRERLARCRRRSCSTARCFRDDEMIASGTGEKTGRRMGHMPIDGADGSLAALKGLGKRRIYIHINNTNPILIDGSPERRRVEAAGLEVARRRTGDFVCEIDDARRTGSRAARHRREALSPSASVSRAAARRQVHQGPGAGLGAQPLLLSGVHPAEGREPDRALRGLSDPARVALAPARSRRRTGRRRRDCALAQAHRRARARPRVCHLAARAPSRHQIRGRGLRAFRAREDRCSRRLRHRSPNCSRR